jgi:hypothetical protein
MAFPVNVATRSVSFGGAVSVEAGTPLVIRVETKANRSLIKASSGYRLESLNHTLESSAGDEIVFSLPVTDQNGWIDAASRLAIVVDTDQHSHLYTSKVTILSGSTKVAEYVYENYPVPTGTGVLDGDTMLLDDPAQPGVLVAIPETWAGGGGLSEAEVLQLIEENGGVSAWGDITGKPTTFPPSTHTHAWADITGKPTTFTPSAHSHSWSEVTDKPTTFTPATHTHAWGDVTGKPTTFAPSAHSHAISDVTGLQAALDNAGGATTMRGALYSDGAWPSRPTSPLPVTWYSTLDEDAPVPSGMIDGDVWIQIPPAA